MVRTIFTNVICSTEYNATLSLYDSSRQLSVLNTLIFDEELSFVSSVLTHKRKITLRVSSISKIVIYTRHHESALKSVYPNQIFENNIYLNYFALTVSRSCFISFISTRLNGSNTITGSMETRITFLYVSVFFFRQRKRKNIT